MAPAVAPENNQRIAPSQLQPPPQTAGPRNINQALDTDRRKQSNNRICPRVWVLGPGFCAPGAPYPSSSNALCRARTACGTFSPSIRQVIRISLVVISSMLIPASYSVRNIRLA